MASYRKMSTGWKVIVSKRDQNGKLRQMSKSGFSTKSEAKVYAAKIESQNGSVIVAKRDVVFSEYFDNWYKTYKENRVAASTLNRYRVTSSIIKKYFGNQKLQSIKRNHYQKFINVFGKNHSKDTMQKTNSTVKACIRAAIFDDIITKDFTTDVELVYDSERTLRVEYLNVSEINQLINMTASKLSPRFTSRYMILTAIYTGMRLGEIQALTWKDISFERHTISINKAWNYQEGGGFKKPKTSCSYRTVRVNKTLLGYLKQLKTNNYKMVFENDQSTIPSSNAVNIKLRALLKECGLKKKNFHFHSLRHSHVAYLLFKGVDIYAISKRLGHSDMTTTVKKYAYLIDEYKARSDDKIESLIDHLGGQQLDNKVAFLSLP
ncbi:tyrosine-type recombinase/integrase [Liquorilactobacillus satsumensis]|uniref:tyrosine-type recombinase/integrase n=1 Tax=Liquorilactobacillus satsumensis TaxID=259059 RepID=UPI00345DA7F7